MIEIFELEILQIQPSQLYISQKKLDVILANFESKGKSALGIIPIKKLNNDLIYTDGHTRAYVASLKGMKKIQVEWEIEDLDWEMYQECVKWCKEENIHSITDLSKRIVTHEDYEILWYGRCDKMQKEILERRKSK